MTPTILRSTAAALAFAGALAFASPSDSRDDDVQGQSERQKRSPGECHRRHRRSYRDLRQRQQEDHLEGQYSGLTGPATAAHFHGPAPVGKNAGVMIPIAPATSPLEGSATLNDAQAKALIWTATVCQRAHRSQ